MQSANPTVPVATVRDSDDAADPAVATLPPMGAAATAAKVDLDASVEHIKGLLDETNVAVRLRQFLAEALHDLHIAAYGFAAARYVDGLERGVTQDSAWHKAIRAAQERATPPTGTPVMSGVVEIDLTDLADAEGVS